MNIGHVVGPSGVKSRSSQICSLLIIIVVMYDVSLIKQLRAVVKIVRYG